MTRDVTPNFKTPKEEKPAKSVASRRSARNRKKGRESQNLGLKILEAVFDAQPRWRGRRANEETCDHLPVRVEFKAGLRGGANQVWTAYRNARDQADAAKSVGDCRPFVAGFRPDGLRDVLYVVRGADLDRFAEACVDARTEVV